MIYMHRMLLVMMLLSVLTLSCEQSFIPDLTTDLQELVVEGYIEAGTDTRPPFVILTKSQPFYEQLGRETLDGLFVHDAIVTVSGPQGTVSLDEICLSELPPNLAMDLLQQFGISSDTLLVNFCVYTDLTMSLQGSPGETYYLTILADGFEASAQTTIPAHVEVDSFRFVSPSSTAPDTLREMRGYLEDPAGTANYYRFLTRVNNQPWYPGFNSVVNDRFFDGGSFEFPIPRGEDRNAEFDPGTFGLYTVGDTVRVRWLSIDSAQYDFWNTLEFNAINQGPFSSYTRVASNINGGLGIWGGMSVSEYRLLAE